MTITSTDLQAALASAGLPTDGYLLSNDAERLLAQPGTVLHQSHVRLTVTPETYARLAACGWPEVAAGYLGHGILLASTQRPDADTGRPASSTEAAGATGAHTHGYPSALAFAAHALVTPRAAAHRAGEQRYGWSAWVVALALTLVGSVAAGEPDGSGARRALSLVASALLGSLILLVLVAALIWLVRQLCGSRHVGVAHGRSTPAAVTQTTVATGVPVLVAELALVLVGGGDGTAIGALAILWASVILVLLAATMFRVSVARAVLAVIGAYVAFAIARVILYAAISFATR